MSLKTELLRLATYKDKLTLDEIIDELKESATQGKYQKKFYSDEVVFEDMLILRDQYDLDVEFINMNGYASPHIWVIEWW